MWVKTEYGRLVNMRQVYTVRVMVSQQGHWVEGGFGSEQIELVDFTKPRSEAEARRALALIAESIAKGRLLLDLQGMQPPGDG